VHEEVERPVRDVLDPGVAAAEVVAAPDRAHRVHRSPRPDPARPQDLARRRNSTWTGQRRSFRTVTSSDQVSVQPGSAASGPGFSPPRAPRRRPRREANRHLPTLRNSTLTRSLTQNRSSSRVQSWSSTPTRSRSSSRSQGRSHCSTTKPRLQPRSRRPAPRRSSSCPKGFRTPPQCRRRLRRLEAMSSSSKRSDCGWGSWHDGRREASFRLKKLRGARTRQGDEPRGKCAARARGASPSMRAATRAPDYEAVPTPGARGGRG
jgi:hypothetical protein